jgi:hypothetical protein
MEGRFPIFKAAQLFGHCAKADITAQGSARSADELVVSLASSLGVSTAAFDLLYHDVEVQDYVRSTAVLANGVLTARPALPPGPLFPH